MILFIQRILTTTVIKFSNKFFNEISHSILMLIHCVKNEKSLADHKESFDSVRDSINSNINSIGDNSVF